MSDDKPKLEFVEEIPTEKLNLSVDDVEEIIEVEDLRKVVEFKGRAPRIKFGDEFHQMKEREKIEYLIGLSSTMNHAADLMQQERNALALDITKMDQAVKNAEAQVDIQKTINQNLMATLNEQTQANAKKCAALEEKIANLQGMLDAGGPS